MSVPSSTTCPHCNRLVFFPSDAALRTQLAEAREEIAQWATWGVIEIAVRNPNVASYMDHWEKRATLAEAKLARAREALKTELDIVNEKNRGRTHYEGCAENHPLCAVAQRISQALKEIDPPG